MNITIKGSGLTDNVNVYQGRSHESGKAGKSGKNGTVIYAGGLNVNATTRDGANEKRAMARKQAMRYVEGAWNKDNQLAKSREGIEELKKKKLADIAEYNKKLNSIEDSKRKCMEEYGIDPESAEHKDLLLLEKYQDYVNGVPVDRFTKEEKDRLWELEDVPRTEYQDKMLALNDARCQYYNKIADAQMEIEMMVKSETDMDINQPKIQSATMGKAQDAAESIMKAVAKDIMSDYIEEGMNNVEKRAEEAEKEAEKIKEKQEEQEKRLEEAKENREEKEELIEEIREKNKEEDENKADILGESYKADRMSMRVSNNNNRTSNMEEAQSNVIKIMKNNNMIEEDLKGIKIDFNY